ncbi:hypothetical protein HPB47_001208 [Ixodes persulcatus]|uniref:Uncharacterized protein n=1 Tax=Ixodes persulcatus TaxID=34615 RepID=A0AC60PR46_IXOPE|nr:hypothetical protein HPB47_001208 [Ixodes persulcatus]
MRAMVADQANGKVLPFVELRDLVLTELKMTPEEYKRRFHKTLRAHVESWSQFLTQFDIHFGYYLESRGVEAVEELRQLIISDRMKQYALRQEQCGRRKIHEWRAADERPVCFYCGEGDYVYRRRPGRQFGLRGFAPNDPRARLRERPREIEEYLRRPAFFVRDASRGFR